MKNEKRAKSIEDVIEDFKINATDEEMEILNDFKEQLEENKKKSMESIHSPNTADKKRENLKWNRRYLIE